MKKWRLTIMILVMDFLFITASFIVCFFPSNKLDIDLNSQILLKNNNIVIDLNIYVNSLDSSVFNVCSIDDTGQYREIRNIKFYDLIGKSDPELFIIFDGYGIYSWKNMDDTVNYNDKFLWCRACNGRYIIVDLKHRKVFMTFSDLQKIICTSFGFIVIIAFFILKMLHG